MYEHKIFHAGSNIDSESAVVVINNLLEAISRLGWEPVDVNLEKMYVLAKRKKDETLHD